MDPTPPLPSPQKRPNQIQGPRPSALRLNPDSHKIKKPPLPPTRHNPVIIYSVSPKVIHTDPNNFMSLVQRLTGLSSSDFAPSSSSGGLSPAARLAATEHFSPRVHSPRPPPPAPARDDDDDIMDLIEGVDLGMLPGILSPAPGMIPPVASGFFSPASDPHALSFLSDFVLSPYVGGGGGGGSSFVVSPSGFFSATPGMSPLTSPDFFNLFMDL